MIRMVEGSTCCLSSSIFMTCGKARVIIIEIRIMGNSESPPISIPAISSLFCLMLVLPLKLMILILCVIYRLSRNETAKGIIGILNISFIKYAL